MTLVIFNDLATLICPRMEANDRLTDQYNALKNVEGRGNAFL
jgi:hypothetical protein